METLIAILTFLGVPFIFLFLLFIALEIYPKLKVPISDFITFFGWVSKKIRKRTIEFEIEGTINPIIRKLNNDARASLLPECDVKWVTKENVSNILENNKVILRMDFNKQSHDQNFYKCIYQYNQTGLIPVTKPFIKADTRDAIDLLMTKVMLLKAKRSALSIFNSEFTNRDVSVKEKYQILHGTYEKGFFQRIIISELSLVGEKLFLETPNPENIEEIEKFIFWFHEVATRAKEEKSLLHFKGRYFKVAIILVANDNTYQKYGIDPYLSRARKYAADNYDGIYLISRGYNRSKIVLQIADILTKNGEFKKLVRNPHLETTGPDSDIITCLPIKSLNSNILEHAWDEIEQSQAKGNTIIGTIENIDISSIRVNFQGLYTIIENNELSEIASIYPKSYFEIGDELELKIVSFNRDENELLLSNKSTSTDPIKSIIKYDRYIAKSMKATIVRIVCINQKEIGLELELDAAEKIKGFIDRKELTYSRFTSISKKYKVGNQIKVVADHIHKERKEMACVLEEFPDPWQNLIISINQLITGHLRIISESHLILEFEEGVEVIVYQSEYSWNDPVKYRDSINVDDVLNLKVQSINHERRMIVASIKQANPSQELTYFEKNKNKRINFIVDRIEKNFCLGHYQNLNIKLLISEIDYVYIERIEDYIEIGKEYLGEIIDFDQYHNCIIVSMKRLKQQDIQYFIKSDIPFFKGKVIKVQKRIVIVQLQHDNHFATGILTISEVSNLFFIEENFLTSIFEPGDQYNFSIKKYEQTNELLFLSRKLFLNKEKFEYGIHYQGKIFRSNKDLIFYGNKNEGIMEIKYPEAIDPGKQNVLYYGSQNGKPVFGIL